MKKLINKILGKITAASVVAFIIVTVLVLACLGFSWIATCGIVKLVTLCFGLTFNWAWATGIWIILCVISNIFTGMSGK